jgi:hypothetical protein
MENQQAIYKWAVLAGLLMGDGYFTMIPYSNHKKSGTGFTAVRPMICFCNQDGQILNFVTSLYDEFGIKYYLETKEGTRLSPRPITNITVMRFDGVKRVLNEIIPFLVGDKQGRAKLLLRYVSKERRGRREYDPDDAQIIREYLALRPASTKGKPSRLVEVLRDYEQNARHCEDIVHPAA